MNLPEGHQTVMPYLILKSADRFIDFIAHVFGARETARYPSETGGVMHAEANIGGSTLMYADATDDWSPQPGGMYVYVEDVDATYAKAMEKGATSLMEPQDRDYGYTCGFADTNGNSWWVTKA